MSDIKTKVQKMDPNVTARDIAGMAGRASNIYEALAIISKRARQLQVDLKDELKTKLEEFEVVSDTIEEIHENKEQIEISKFYERLPNPALIATHEFLNSELTWREREERQPEIED
ncbi:MAG: DNA-directed RNA polymerase subunit omega [Saprospiraceae bacterium]|jgi:DNA-directed RNA polymerase subunit K/omega|nr:DNA-directed RNA polymerase subunit omega [Saprospiraceae bacterium]